MKTILLFSVLFCAIVLPANGELTDVDLDKIRLIVTESEQRLRTEIAVVEKGLKSEITSLEKELKSEIGVLRVEVAEISGRVQGVEKQITWLMGVIIVAVGIPQIIAAGGIANKIEELKNSEKK